MFEKSVLRRIFGPVVEEMTVFIIRRPIIYTSYQIGLW
jgi:hypothetical protein